ncbi:right-handed parallel beta-helix repeat-containing protein, partial [Candidatus Bathyarchaeota archaeon]|nr:right-handed parallel beta-helix repeat-containing protein [Candidatus Bathyarchaeota archaeon]
MGAPKSQSGSDSKRARYIYSLTGDIDSTGVAITVRRENAVLDGKLYTITGNGQTGTGVMIAADNVTVRNVKVADFSTGILFGEDIDQWPGINSSTVTGNFITGCDMGIRCYRHAIGPPFPLPGGKDERIIGNKLEDNTYAILIFTSGSIISDNVITSNQYGISDEHDGPGANLAGLGANGNNIISGNNLTNNSIGIQLLGCSGETVSSNYVRTNTGHGILLGPKGQYHDFSLVSSNNTLSGNT